MRTKAQFDRTPRSVFVTVDPPVTHGKKLESAYQDWKPIGSQIISDVQADTPEPVSTPSAPRQHPVSTPEPVKPMMEYHHYDRFLIGVKATLKLSGKWQTPAGVFSLLYNKYNLANVHDVAVGLEILAKANEVESKQTKIGMQYLLTTSAFEELLNRCQVSKYHVAEMTGIDESEMCGYCKGVIISAADAQRIADALDVQIEELDGLCEAPEPVKKQSLQSLLQEVDAIMNKAVK